MAINDAEAGVESILSCATTGACHPLFEKAQGAFLGDLGPHLSDSAVGRWIALLALHARTTTAATLNEADAASAIADALADQIKFFPRIELDEFFAKEIYRILSPKHDLHILCGHLRIVLEDRNDEHKDKIIKFFKSVVCQ